MKVSFIVPVYGQLEITRDCVASLRDTVGNIDYELIIVDDGSAPETENGLKEFVDERTRLIRNPQNSGFARANNLGASHATGEILVLLNNDLLFKPNWLAPLLKPFESMKLVGVIGNVQLRADSEEIDHAGFYIDWKGELLHKRTENKATFGTPDYSKFEFVTGACCAIRRELYLSVGGFDEAYENGCEDIDLCFRLRRLGRRNYVANKSVIYHRISATRDVGSLREEKNFRLLQRRWKPQIARLAAQAWVDHYIDLCWTDSKFFRWDLAKQAIPRWLTLKSGPAPAGLKIANSRLEQNERHWKSLLEGLDDEAIKKSESSLHANWLKERFSFEKLFFDSGEGEGPWIREEAFIHVPKGSIASDIAITGSIAAPREDHPEEYGQLGLRLTVNECQSVVAFPLPDGDFELAFDFPPIVVDQHSTLHLELLGTGKHNTYAYLGRKIAKWFFIPKSIREKLGAYRKQNLNRRLTLTGLKINDEQVLDFKTDPTSPLNFEYINRHGNIGINLVGWFKAELGIGESARLAAKAIKATKIEHALVPLKVNCLSSQGDSTYDSELQSSNPHPVNIFHIDAPQSPDIDHYHKENFRKDKYNIAYWAWELPEFPDSWVKYFRYYDEIWTPSNFCRDAIAIKSPVPVITVPHSIDFSIPEMDYRDALGLPKDKYLFCFAYDLNSYQERKNPKAIIKAYKEAFAGHEKQNDVGVVIKTHSTANNPEAYKELLDELKGIENFYVIDRTLSRQMLYGLIKACDSYVSLHRSEGFGLTVAESMFLEKPVLSTNWSATSEFLNVSNGCPVDFNLIKLEKTHGPYQKGQIWADPFVEHAAQYMQSLVADNELSTRLGKNAKRTISDLFSPKRIGSIYEKRLKAITQW